MGVGLTVGNRFDLPVLIGSQIRFTVIRDAVHLTGIGLASAENPVDLVLGRGIFPIFVLNVKIELPVFL